MSYNIKTYTYFFACWDVQIISRNWTDLDNFIESVFKIFKFDKL